MRYEDLPPALRAQVDAKVGAPGKKKRTTRRESGVDGPGRCHCGAEFATYKQWEREHMRMGHRRFDVDLSISGI